MGQTLRLGCRRTPLFGWYLRRRLRLGRRLWLGRWLGRRPPLLLLLLLIADVVFRTWCSHSGPIPEVSNESPARRSRRHLGNVKLADEFHTALFGNRALTQRQQNRETCPSISSMPLARRSSAGFPLRPPSAAEIIPGKCGGGRDPSSASRLDHKIITMRPSTLPAPRLLKIVLISSSFAL